MTDYKEHSERIARNTLMLYVRMLALMLVGLYTSRVVLGALGEDEALHLRVPTTGLVTKVNAAVEQLAHGNDGHVVTPSGSVRRRSAHGKLPIDG